MTVELSKWKARRLIGIEDWNCNHRSERVGGYTPLPDSTGDKLVVSNQQATVDYRVKLSVRISFANLQWIIAGVVANRALSPYPRVKSKLSFERVERGAKYITRSNWNHAAGSGKWLEIMYIASEKVWGGAFASLRTGYYSERKNEQ